MRKLISLGLATAMVASMAVSAFAAGSVSDSAVGERATFRINPDAAKATFSVNGTSVEVAKEAGVPLAISLGEAVDEVLGGDYNVTAYTTSTRSAALTVAWGAAFDGITVTRVNPSANITMEVNNAGSDSTVYIGDWQNDINEILYPVALVEDGDQNGKDGVKPGKSIYFMIKAPFSDLDVFKFDVSKGEGAKQIKKVSVVEKRFSDPLVMINGNSPAFRTTGRNSFVKVELADNMTDDEFKVSFDLKVKVDKKDNPYGMTKGTASKKFEEIGATWMYNTTDTTDDTEFMAGTGGIMVKPVKNEENTVLWTDENRDLARLTFTADSDVAKYFPKLSTKWPNATYAQLFDDQDAFVFDFVGNPKISSTSRAVLELFCPFIDTDDEYTVDPESVVIYQVADDATLAASTEVELAKAILDGRLIDVTDKFTAGENEDGDFVYTTKTRTLGTYIIAEKAPSEEAFEEAEGEAPDEKPTEDTGKDNPGTGR